MIHPVDTIIVIGSSLIRQFGIWKNFKTRSGNVETHPVALGDCFYTGILYMGMSVCPFHGQSHIEALKQKANNKAFQASMDRT